MTPKVMGEVLWGKEMATSRPGLETDTLNVVADTSSSPEVFDYQTTRQPSENVARYYRGATGASAVMPHPMVSQNTEEKTYKYNVKLKDGSTLTLSCCGVEPREYMGELYYMFFISNSKRDAIVITAMISRNDVSLFYVDELGEFSASVPTKRRINE